jgi:CheY-like chemotaxis protein
MPAARVLVVDDEPSLLFLARLSLELAGHQVTEAPNGAVALEQLARADFDVVVTDLMMPVLDGGELLRRLRSDERTRDLPVIVYTSVDRPEVDADIVVKKPSAPHELPDAVDRVLGERAR